jgi:hypothetical protein
MKSMTEIAPTTAGRNAPILGIVQTASGAVAKNPASNSAATANAAWRCRGVGGRFTNRVSVSSSSRASRYSPRCRRA